MKPAELRALVSEMRALGVTECEGIKLGPVPRDPNAKPKHRTLEEQAEVGSNAVRKKLRALGYNASDEMVEALKGRI